MNSIPTKLTSSQCNYPWIYNYIKRITRRKQRAYNQVLRSNLATDWSKYYYLKRECQPECCTAFNSYVSNLVDPNKNIVTKPLRSFVKTKRQNNVGVSTLKHEVGPMWMPQRRQTFWQTTSDLFLPLKMLAIFLHYPPTQHLVFHQFRYM